jgi:hypothetical protein
MIGMLLAVIPLASALIFVDPVAPSAKAHMVCNNSYHVDGNLTGTYEYWRVRKIVYINSNRRVVYWSVNPQGKGWRRYGSITCE